MIKVDLESRRCLRYFHPRIADYVLTLDLLAAAQIYAFFSNRSWNSHRMKGWENQREEEMKYKKQRAICTVLSRDLKLEWLTL